MPEWNAQRGDIVFLGGSFNPPHIGHLRLAIEIREALGNIHVALLPCAHPVHKKRQGLLPFSLRVQMLEAATNQLEGIDCDPREGLRSTPSYTWDTLQAYRELFPAAYIFFMVGSPDYAELPTWHNGLRLPEYCHLLIVPRGNYGQDDFAATTRQLWPSSSAREPLFPQIPRFSIRDHCQLSGSVHFLQIPWLAISASFIRERWLTGKNTDFLMPTPVEQLLQKHTALVYQHWQNTEK